MAVGIDQTRLWGDVAISYLGEVAAASLAEQALRHLTDPEAHASLSAWLATEQRRAEGLNAHLGEVGPPLPLTLVGALRDVAALCGGAIALKSPDAVLNLAAPLANLGLERFGSLAERFSGSSLEAQRYRRFEAEGQQQATWLEAWHAERAQDALVPHVEEVTFTSRIPASIKLVAEVLTEVRHWSALLGMPVEMDASKQCLGADLRYTLRLGTGPFSVAVDGEVIAWKPPDLWVERRTRVPFSFWEHHRRLTTLEEGTLLSDRILVRPRGLPMAPAALRPTPPALLLQLGLWFFHARLRGYIKGIGEDR